MVCDRKVCLQPQPGLSERQCDLKDEGKAASERGAGSLLSLDDTAERRTRVLLGKQGKQAFRNGY